MEPVAAGRRGVALNRGVTPAELREAERGLKLMLARKFSAVWIAENARDLLGQANIEYAEWLEDNPPARNPVGWLLTCAYRRALNLLDAERRKPRPASLDTVFQLADETTPTPEQQALEHDRQSRLREALSFLPPKECKLLALVYFEGHSIREAGRKVGWQKSAADRHHGAALERLRALVGDRSLLSPASLGLAAWAVAKGEGRRHWRAPLESILDAARQVAVVGGETLMSAAHRAAELWRRVMPFSEPANAVAASGAGRAVGYCGAAVGALVCGLAATGVIGPGVGVGGAERTVPAKLREAKPARQASAPASSVGEGSAQSGSEASSRDRSEATATGSRSRRKRQRQIAPKATTKQTVEEFGVDRGGAENTEAETSPEARGGESSAPAPSSQPSPAPQSPRSAASSEFGL
jgi:RNA polymerase sigma factor (sigma-70 family)